MGWEGPCRKPSRAGFVSWLHQPWQVVSYSSQASVFLTGGVDHHAGPLWGHHFYLFFFLIFIWLHWVLVVACRIFDLCCVLQEQGSNPGPLYWDCGVLATGPPSKSPSLSTLHTSSTDCSGWNSGPVYPGTSTFPCRQWTTLAEPVSLSILEKMPSDDFKCSEKPNSPGEFQGKP